MGPRALSRPLVPIGHLVAGVNGNETVRQHYEEMSPGSIDVDGEGNVHFRDAVYRIVTERRYRFVCGRCRSILWVWSKAKNPKPPECSNCREGWHQPRDGECPRCGGYSWRTHENLEMPGGVRRKTCFCD